MQSYHTSPLPSVKNERPIAAIGAANRRRQPPPCHHAAPLVRWRFPGNVPSPRRNIPRGAASLGWGGAGERIFRPSSLLDLAPTDRSLLASCLMVPFVAEGPCVASPQDIPAAFRRTQGALRFWPGALRTSAGADFSGLCRRDKKKKD